MGSPQVAGTGIITGSQAVGKTLCMVSIHNLPFHATINRVSGAYLASKRVIPSQLAAGG